MPPVYIIGNSKTSLNKQKHVTLNNLQVSPSDSSGTYLKCKNTKIKEPEMIV